MMEEILLNYSQQWYAQLNASIPLNSTIYRKKKSNYYILTRWIF